MECPITVQCVGFVKVQSGIGAVLSVQPPEGEKVVLEVKKAVGNHTKNQTDLIAIVMALRSIKPERRGWPITLYAPPGYAYLMLEKNDIGNWMSHTKTNQELVDQARDAVSACPKITVKKANSNDPTFLKCLELAKSACLNVK